MSIVGVIVPVVAFVAVAAWFIRAFVAPPMVAIPSPAALAEAPPAPFEARLDMTGAAAGCGGAGRASARALRVHAGHVNARFDVDGIARARRSLIDGRTAAPR